MMNVLMALEWLEKHLPHWTVEMLGAVVIAPSVVIPWLLLIASWCSDHPELSAGDAVFCPRCHQ